MNHYANTQKCRDLLRKLNKVLMGSSRAIFCNSLKSSCLLDPLRFLTESQLKNVTFLNSRIQSFSIRHPISSPVRNPSKFCIHPIVFLSLTHSNSFAVFGSFFSLFFLQWFFCPGLQFCDFSLSVSVRIILGLGLTHPSRI